MERMKRTIEDIRERVELGARRLCGRITPDKRVAVILTMLVLFGSGSIWMTVSSIYNFGKQRGRLEVERIEAIRLPPEPMRDSINFEKLFEYERSDE
jgi:hypothetical protein